MVPGTRKVSAGDSGSSCRLLKLDYSEYSNKGSLEIDDEKESLWEWLVVAPWRCVGSRDMWSLSLSLLCLAVVCLEDASQSAIIWRFSMRSDFPSFLIFFYRFPFSSGLFLVFKENLVNR